MNEKMNERMVVNLGLVPIPRGETPTYSNTAELDYSTLIYEYLKTFTWCILILPSQSSTQKTKEKIRHRPLILLRSSYNDGK